ncbi:MAG: GNAT family N-acetyltransferase [Actinomycetota bacterium]|nr:GNAT family N-acetyltransferase [Actinomycetota bacterium]
MQAAVGTVATQADLEALVASVAGLFREDAGRHDSLADIGWPAREGTAYYSALMGDQASLLLLARDGDQVIGHLVGKISAPGPVRTAAVAVLESMRVAPESRRAGVGSLLIQHFLTWARERGARQASVTAYAANQVAQRLYERHGFAPASITSRAPL